MIKYTGTRKSADGNVIYVFVVNGMQKEVRENALKQHPGFYAVMPSDVKRMIDANKQWMSKL